MVVTLRLTLGLLLVTQAAAFAQQAPVTIRGRVSAADTRAALPRARHGWYLKSLTIDGTDMTDHVIELGAGASVSADVVVSVRGGTIAGRVAIDERGARTGSVVVFPQDRAKWFERSRFIKVVSTQDGFFRVGSLPPADYYVAVMSDVPKAATREILESLVSRAVTVTLDEGEARRVDLSR
jgi:hypothetical protein